MNHTLQKILPVIFLLAHTIYSNAQAINASKDTLKKHVYYLASEELKGRATGSPGQKKAALYIHNAFERYELSKLPNNSYFHYYKLKRNHKNFHSVNSKGNIVFWPWHFYYVSSLNHDDTLHLPMQFTGFASESEIASLDISGKIISFIANCPKEAYQKIKNIREQYGNKIYFVLFPEKNKDCELAWSAEYELSYYNLAENYHNSQKSTIHEEWAKPLAQDSLQIYYCFPDVMRNIFGMTDAELEKIARENEKSSENLLTKIEIQDLSLISSYKDTTQEIVVENVGGIIYGEDTTQTIVVTAHYDHIGEDFGKINYGADDNASGTSVVLESARQLTKIFENSKPQRNILFLSFSGEEIGLYGSEAYVRNPVFPMNETVININMDMVGRWDERHEEDKSFVYLLTAGQGAKDFYKLGNKKIRKPKGFDVTNNAGAKEKMIFKYGSDHYSFYQRNVPIAVFFTGLHEDYHTPRDIPEKLNYSNLTNITDLISKYIYLIATDTVNYPLRKTGN